MGNINIIIKIILRAYPRIINEYYKRYNKLLLRLLRVKIGKNPVIFNKVYFRMSPKGTLVIGDNFTFTSGGGINPLGRNIRGLIFVAHNARITIGNDTGISCSCLRAKEEITIGNGVNIGGDCIIMDTDAHNLDWRIRAGRLKDQQGNIISDTNTAKSSPVRIEDNVLIGTRCIILKGVTIGARSIIAAGSIVTKSIPPDCIAGGNPCKVIKCINGQ